MRCEEKTAAYKSRTIEIRVCAELTSHHATSFPPIHCSPSMYIYKTANIYIYILYTHTLYIHIPHIVCPLYAMLYNAYYNNTLPLEIKYIYMNIIRSNKKLS